MFNMKKRQGLRGIVRRTRTQDHLMEAFQREGLRYKASLGLRSGILIKFFKDRDHRVSKPNAKKGKGTSSPIEKKICGKCGKKHYGDCLKGTDNCFGREKSGQRVRDFNNVRGQDKGSGQEQASGSNEAPKKKMFYALRSWGEQETSPNVVTYMLKFFSIDVYALHDPASTLSFDTLLVAKIFYILSDILHEPFKMSTPMGESVVAI